MDFYAIHSGLNAVESNHYQGWDGTLSACEADARSMSLFQPAMLSGSRSPQWRQALQYRATR